MSIPKNVHTEILTQAYDEIMASDPAMQAALHAVTKGAVAGATTFISAIAANGAMPDVAEWKKKAILIAKDRGFSHTDIGRSLNVSSSYVGQVAREAKKLAEESEAVAAPSFTVPPHMMQPQPAAEAQPAPTPQPAPQPAAEPVVQSQPYAPPMPNVPGLTQAIWDAIPLDQKAQFLRLVENHPSVPPVSEAPKVEEAEVVSETPPMMAQPIAPPAPQPAPQPVAQPQTPGFDPSQMVYGGAPQTQAPAPQAPVPQPSFVVPQGEQPAAPAAPSLGQPSSAPMPGQPQPQLQQAAVSTEGVGSLSDIMSRMQAGLGNG